MAARISGGARNAALDSGTRAWMNSTNGRLSFYSGAQPANGDTAMAGTLLATLSFTSASAASSGSTTITFSASTVATVAAGTAQSAVIYLSTETAPGSAAGATDKRIVVTVGTSGADINFDNNAWTSGQNITVSSLTVTQPAA